MAADACEPLARAEEEGEEVKSALRFLFWQRTNLRLPDAMVALDVVFESGGDGASGFCPRWLLNFHASVIRGILTSW
jgi:hypothetical protein